MKSLVFAFFFAFVSFQAFAKSSEILFDTGQYDKAFRAAYADALKGNASDAFVIGRILLEGLGSAEKDQQLATRLLEESSNAKNMEAAEYLGMAYYEAKLLPKSNNLAFKYLSLAKDLGADDLDQILIEVAEAISDGEISQETCDLYFEDKRNSDFAFNLGQCIENAFLEGSANDFYLKAFDNRTVNALIPAMRLALKQDNEPLSRVFERLETFLLDASNSETKEMTDLLKSNQLALFDIAKREKNNDLSYQIAVYYDEGTLFGKTDEKQALEFYRLAKSQGKSGLGNIIQVKTELVEGPTSKAACRGYNKKDKTIARRLALCANKGHIKGYPGEYFLLAFANGDTASFLDAAETLIDRTNKTFAPEKILNAIPDFREKANAKQKEKFAALIERRGHSSQDCEEKFDSLNSKISGDIYSCLLSAETAEFSDDFTAFEVAISAWKDGYGDVLSNPAYAERLKQILINSSSADGLMILAALEKEPKEHFNQAVKFFEEGRISKEEVTQALVLEFQLFSEGRWSEFARSARHQDEIELLIKTAELSLLPPEILAEFLAFLVKEQKELSNDENIKKELASIQFNLDWVTILKDIAFDVAGTFVSPVVAENCSALQLAIDNDGLVPETKLKEAKVKLLPQCDIFNISADDLQKLIDNNPDDGFKRLGIVLTADKRPACELIALYLQNEDSILQSREKFAYNPKDQMRRCVNQDPAISYLYSVNLLDNGKYAEALDISKRGCEQSNYSSCAVSGFIEHRKFLDKSISNSIAIRRANKFLKVGFEKFDGNSTMLYLSINRPSFRNPKLPLPGSMTADTANEIEESLRDRSFSGMPIVEADSCLATSFTGNCRSYCKPAEIYIKKSSTEKFHKIFGDTVVRQSFCK